MLHIADCSASNEQRGPPLFFEQGVVLTELRCHDYMAITMRCALCTQTRAKDDEPSRSQVRDEEQSL